MHFAHISTHPHRETFEITVQIRIHINREKSQSKTSLLMLSDIWYAFDAVAKTEKKNKLKEEKKKQQIQRLCILFTCTVWTNWFRWKYKTHSHSKCKKKTP